MQKGHHYLKSTHQSLQQWVESIDIWHKHTPMGNGRPCKCEWYSMHCQCFNNINNRGTHQQCLSGSIPEWLGRSQWKPIGKFHCHFEYSTSASLRNHHKRTSSQGSDGGICKWFQQSSIHQYGCIAGNCCEKRQKQPQQPCDWLHCCADSRHQPRAFVGNRNSKRHRFRTTCIRN